MKINIVQGFDKVYDGYVMPKYEGNVSVYEGLNEEEKLVIEKQIAKKKFEGKVGTSLRVELIHKGRLITIVYIGLGSKDKLKPYQVIESYFKALKGLTGEVFIGSEGVDVNHIAEAINYANYDFNKYKTDKKEVEATEYDILAPKDASTLKGETLAAAVKITRNLVNEPANVIYPETLAEEAIKLGKEYGFKVEVLCEAEIERLGMEAFLSVARAAEKRPKLIIMRHLGNPEDPENILGLVGKGLTYDTGGLSLKPSTGMSNMKTDMGGAATVIGAMCAISKLGVKQNIVTIVAACENSIGGNAYRPGDVIGSMAGKTIEVENTDAEGRLTLVDAIHYAITEEKVKEVIDVATLTGAVLVALGETTTGAVTNSDEIYQEISVASEIAGERVWQLPSFPEYNELNKSKIADIKNTGGRFAGSITAGLFLGSFVGKTPWLHLDIAGASCASAPYGYYNYGGTGQMVRTLFNYYVNKK